MEQKIKFSYMVLWLVLFSNIFFYWQSFDFAIPGGIPFKSILIPCFFTSILIFYGLNFLSVNRIVSWSKQFLWIVAAGLSFSPFMGYGGMFVGSPPFIFFFLFAITLLFIGFIKSIFKSSKEIGFTETLEGLFYGFLGSMLALYPILTIIDHRHHYPSDFTSLFLIEFIGFSYLFLLFNKEKTNKFTSLSVLFVVLFAIVGVGTSSWYPSISWHVTLSLSAATLFWGLFKSYKN